MRVTNDRYRAMISTAAQPVTDRHWDGRVWRLHVTDSKEGTLELRALMSARDSSSAWELRCQMREKLVTWLRQNHPDALPRVRAEVASYSLAARTRA